MHPRNFCFICDFLFLSLYREQKNGRKFLIQNEQKNFKRFFSSLVVKRASLAYLFNQAQRDQIWRNFATWAKSSKSLAIFWRVNLVLGKILKLLGPIIMLLGKFSLL